MASASLTARFVRRSSRSLTSPKVACAHCSGDITASQFSIPLSSLLLRFLLLPRFYHFFTRTLRVRVRCLSWWQRDPVGTAWSTKVAPQRGQAQGPLIHSAPPLVPTGSWDASTSMDRIPRVGWQKSSGGQGMLLICIIYTISNTGGNRYAQAYHPSFSACSGSRGGRGHRCSTTPTEQRYNG